MKKAGLITVAILLLIALAAWSSGPGYLRVVQLITDRIVLARSTEELRQVSDLIVVFTPASQKNVLHYYDDGSVSFGYTRTTGTVSRVLSGDAAEGDTIVITEECYTTSWSTVLWTQDGYLPMRTGERYLLFLKAYEDGSVYEGMYFPVDLEHGKYLIEVPAELTPKQLELAGVRGLDTYVQWYAEVREMYPELF